MFSEMTHRERFHAVFDGKPYDRLPVYYFNMWKETAMRWQVPIVILIWNDGGYGLIEWKQMNEFSRAAHVSFDNPDFVKYAESFGAQGYRVTRTGDLRPTLEKALANETLSIIDCPVDYSENLKLTEKLGKLVCPV